MDTYCGHQDESVQEGSARGGEYIEEASPPAKQYQYNQVGPPRFIVSDRVVVALFWASY